MSNGGLAGVWRNSGTRDLDPAWGQQANLDLSWRYSSSKSKSSTTNQNSKSTRMAGSGIWTVTMSVATSVSSPRQSFLQWISNHGFQTFLIVYGLWVFTPFLAPFFMHTGWSSAGKAVYFIYSFFCHQLPERSFFLFGEKGMYSLAEIQMAVYQRGWSPLTLHSTTGVLVVDSGILFPPVIAIFSIMQIMQLIFILTIQHSVFFLRPRIRVMYG